MVAAALVALACPCRSVSPRDLVRLRASGHRRRYSRVRFWSGPTTGLWIGKLTCVNTMTTMTGPPPKGEDGRLAYSVQETARMLGVCDKSIRRLIERGLLRPSRALRHIRIPKAELDRFLRDTR